MGGRGGGNTNPWPTLRYYHVNMYFFDGEKETLYNVWSTVEETDTTAYFETDEWGNQQYYTNVRYTQYTGSGENLKLEAETPQIVGIGWPINLAGQAMGQYYRTEKIYIQKLQVWLNKIYPDWTLKD
ncbi:hypothetical protein QUA43_29945 [Microcoleus sp. N9_B4]|uniref:hypothetical protein n=1 Tax=Microcoleus sp. N9_B4 TaxID=3055386 RepID=UPI002FD1CC9A